MSISPTDKVFFAVVRTGVFVLQSNTTFSVTSSVASPVWVLISAVSAVGGVDLFSSFDFVVNATDNTKGTLQMIGGEAALAAAFAANDRVNITVQVGPSPLTMRVHLRAIPTIDFLLLSRNGVAGSHTPVNIGADPPAGGSVAEFPYGPYAWAAAPGAGLNGSTLTFAQTPPLTQRSAVISATTPPSWNVDSGNFTLTITCPNMSNPLITSASLFNSATLSLRALEKSPGVPLAGYTYLRGHLNDAGTGAGINAPPPAPGTLFGTAIGGAAGWPTTLPLDTNGRMLAVNETGVSSWTAAAATLTITARDTNNVRPDAFVTGLSFKMRQLTADAPYQLRLPYDVVAGTRNLTVMSDAAFAFSAATPSGGTSLFSSSVSPVPQLQWGAFALRAGDAASLRSVLSATAPGFPNESCALPISVTTPAMATITVTPPTLPTARQLLRYQTQLGASVTPTGTQQLEWYLEPTEATDLEFGTPVGPAATNLLRTRALRVIPSNWSAGDRAVRVHVVLRDGGVVLATSDTPAPATVALPIAATLPNINSTLMIDRSGSMAAEFRWLGAMSGALLFAQLVKDRNVNAGKAHGVQAMWFGGWEDVPTPNYPTPAVPTDPLGAGNYGTLLGDRGLGTIIPLNFANFATDASFDVAFTEAATRQQPAFWTAIGTGLLAAKDALLRADPTHTKERVVFLFTDGMENRVPFVNEATQAAGAYWRHPDPALGLPDGVDPQTRIYACALGTAQSFADGLKPACNNTGGIGELDVKFIPSPQPNSAAISTLVQNWFNSSFAFLFGYTALSTPDPELAGGATATHSVMVTEGHSQLVLSVFAATPPSTDWTIDVQPPGGMSVITEAEVLAGALGGSVRLYTGPLHKTFVIDLPLLIPGESQRWAGRWRCHVTRNAATTGDYLFSAMAKQDITFQVALDAPAPTRIGNRVFVRAYLAQEKDLISDAKVVAHVSSPGKWLDDTIARVAGRTKTVKGHDKANDLTNVQAATRAVLAEVMVHRRTFEVPLVPTEPGFYEGSFIVDEPGTWEVLTSADAHRGGARDWARWEKTLEELRTLLPPRAYEHERARLMEEAGNAQAYHLEDDQTFGVTFQPDVQQSSAGGVLRPGELRLFIVPQSADGTLLGVGRASDIVFHTRCGLSWPAYDEGQGTYTARLALHGKNIRVVRGIVLGEDLALREGKRPVPICNDRLDLSHFSVRVLGVEVPLQIRAPMGKLSRVDMELAFPTFAYATVATSSALARLGKDDFEKHAAAAHGVPTFVSALRRAMEVDFARTAEAVAARRYGLAVAQQAACGFCRANGHENALGRFAGQLEAMIGTLLEQWTEQHVESAAHCRDGFFDDADTVRGIVEQLVNVLRVERPKSA